MAVDGVILDVRGTKVEEMDGGGSTLTTREAG